MKIGKWPARLAAVVGFCVTLGCATERYFYTPSASEDRVDQQSGTAFYPIPVNIPQGNARVQSQGIVDLEPKNGGNKITAVHLRLSISNQSATPWSLDVQEQRVDFPNRGSSTPVLASSDSRELPNIVIQPHELRSVDLYFQLPPGADEASKIPEFDFRWSVHTEGQVVARTTPFTRLPVPEPAPGYFSYGWGPYPYPYGYWGSGWWWGPPSAPSYHYRS